MLSSDKMAVSTNPQQPSAPAPQHIEHFDWREFACGWGAAFVNITVTFPINKIMFRQVYQAVKNDYFGAISVCVTV